MAVKDIYQAVLGLDVDKTADLVQKELCIGTDVQTILKEGLIAPMDEVGKSCSAKGNCSCRRWLERLKP